jgi:hypothetical protein
MISPNDPSRARYYFSWQEADAACVELVASGAVGVASERREAKLQPFWLVTWRVTWRVRRR